MSENIADELLEMLVCPVSKSPLTYDKEHQKLIAEESDLVYEIKDGIAIMLAN